MAKSSSLFVCQNCGYESAKWLGQCPSCENWNTFEEQVVAASSKTSSKKSSRSGVAPAAISFASVKTYEHALRRLPTGMQEFDRVLGGGIVFGSVVLIGGEPGIGKSTLLTQLVLNTLNRKEKDSEKSGSQNEHTIDSSPILYIAGEESPEQIALRIERMQSQASTNDSAADMQEQSQWKERLLFGTGTDVDDITAMIEHERPMLVIIDSIQTLSTQDLSGATGSIGQLKESTERITRVAKQYHIPTFLVGHVTKEGTIAGPKVLEHIVDAVLELSGERTGQYRMLRAIKNRFGATDEVGIFEIVESGLLEVSNPSAAFLQERTAHAAGSAIAAVMEGTRPIMVEIQALAVRSQLAVPRRVTRGIPLPRVQVIAAVLEKYCHINLGTYDLYVNVAGGFTITEPAVDLAVAVAIASSVKNKAVPEWLVCVGEVGLLGEVRRVRVLAKRVQEAKRLGFSTVLSSDDARTLPSILQLAGL